MSGIADAYAAIDAANARDPNVIEVDGVRRPAELVYGWRMTAALDDFAPGASQALAIAARGQHIERWTMPRRSYPEGRIGYLTWRKDLQRFHARRLGEIVNGLGFDAALADRIGVLVRKERLKQDSEVQALEDVACLVFLKHYLMPFAAGQEDDKLAGILAKTWVKMSDQGHAAVRAMSPPQRILDLLAKGLADANAGEPT